MDGLELAAGIVGSHIISDSDVYLGEIYQHSNMGIYAQLDYKLWDKLSISAGMRYELNATVYPDTLRYTPSIPGIPIPFSEVILPLKDTIESKPIFRLGLSYKLARATFLRASFGQGIPIPHCIGKFISTSAGGIAIIPNPELISETGWSAEFGIKQGFKIGKWKGFLDVAGFWSEYQNMMEFQAAFFGIAYQVQNIGNTIINGMDLSIMGQGSIGPVSIDLIAGYTFLNPTYKDFDDSLSRIKIQQNSTSDENILKYRNRHTVKFDGQATVKDFSVGFTVMYLSFMEAIDYFLEFGDNTSLPFDPNAETKIYDFRQANQDGSLVLNARIAYQITKFAKASFLVNNVLNNAYSVQPGRVEAPINFTLRADFTF